MYLKSIKEDIPSYFKYPCTVVRTRGTAQGLILKFKALYLKIYDSKAENAYIIEAYRYNDSRPIFIDIVPPNHIREYASQLNCEL